MGGAVYDAEGIIMARTAIATLQTPWDCKWSRFGRVHASRSGPAEGLWVCVYPEGTRRSIHPSECEGCHHFEYESPFFRPSEQRLTTTVAPDRVDAACPRPSRAEKRLEVAVRAVALVLAAVFAGLGFVVLTSVLAIPLTIGLWLGAATCFLLGIWGNFNRRFLPDRSW
jgi:hypothetical protein